MKTTELAGTALDWAVAKCEGFELTFEPDEKDFWINRTKDFQQYYPPFGYLKESFSPSTNWAQGGPIIERECINLTYRHPSFTGLWTAFNDEWDDDKNGVNCGDTPLIAAMRCYVAYKLGYEVDIPQELTQQQEAIK